MLFNKIEDEHFKEIHYDKTTIEFAKNLYGCFLIRSDVTYTELDKNLYLITCYLIAIKHNEKFVPDINKLLSLLSDKTFFNQEDIKKSEDHVMKILNYDITRYYLY